MNTKAFSSKQEHIIADSLGWSVVCGSGARACHPGDIRSNEWLGECKTHVNPDKLILFDKDVWKKICDEASSQFRYPVLFVDDGSQNLDHTWCLFYSHTLPNDYLEYALHYPYNVVTNISFRHDKLDPKLFKIKFNGTMCYICTFNLFKLICDDQGWLQ